MRTGVGYYGGGGLMHEAGEAWRYFFEAAMIRDPIRD